MIATAVLKKRFIGGKKVSNGRSLFNTERLNIKLLKGGASDLLLDHARQKRWIKQLKIPREARKAQRHNILLGPT